MPRLSIILPVLSALSLLPVLLYSNHHTRLLRGNITAYQQVIADEKEKITLLHLEMNRLSHPERISKLSQKLLPYMRIPKRDQIYILSRDGKEKNFYNLHRTNILSDESFFKRGGKPNE